MLVVDVVPTVATTQKGRHPAAISLAETLSADLLTELFDKVFGSNRKELDQEWRASMQSLKTDLEKLEEADAKKK